MKLILGGSLIFSILHSILLWNKAPGISVVLFLIPLLSFFIFFLNKNNKITNHKGLTWAVPIVCLSLTYFIFNNQFFSWLNTIAICEFWLIMCISVTGIKLTPKSLITKSFGLICRPFEHFSHVTHGISDVLFKQEENTEKPQRTKKIVRALVITIPIVLIVVILLASADSIFSNLFSGLGEILNQFIGNESFPETLARIIVAFMFFMYMAGFLHNIFESKPANDEQSLVNKKHKKIDNLTVYMMLTVLNIVYFIFCTIQIIYLFTKAGMPNNISYAEYARQGFFQLMLVSFINFALLFWIHSREKQMSKFIIILEILMEVFTQIIIISAFYRMFLYEQAFGYTYLRLFVYFILAAEFIFMISVIAYTTGKKINLLQSGLIIGTVLYIAINYMNVDAVIAKNNINRYFTNTEKEIDFYYLMSNTGTDAIPEIKKLLNTDDTKLKTRVEMYLWKKKIDLNSEESWMEFNISRQNARKSLKDIKDEEYDYESYREEKLIELY